MGQGDWPDWRCFLAGWALDDDWEVDDRYDCKAVKMPYDRIRNEREIFKRRFLQCEVGVTLGNLARRNAYLDPNAYLRHQHCLHQQTPAEPPTWHVSWLDF